MLDYKKNRLDYGRLLNPPEGFRLDRAVATTYSLDLVTLLSIPVALYYHKNLDGKVTEDRMDIFDAIQKSSDTITVYCQKGKIKVPVEYNRMLTFVEDSVIEILPDVNFKSFHPKIWVIRYKNSKKETLYRLLILSRNLTFDRSYDIAFSLEGFVGNKENRKTKPLCDYLTHLTKSGKFKYADTFIKDLAFVNFEVSEPFNDFKLHPMGFESYLNPLRKQQWKDLIIVSPFLHKETLKQLTAQISGKKILISRKEELDKIHKDILDSYKTYCLSKYIVEGEESENEEEVVNDEPDEDAKLQNLHAKFYIGTDTKGKTNWYLGSANCSKPAMETNEEFLIQITGDSPKIGFNKMLDALLAKDEKYSIFDLYEREEREPKTSDEYDFRPQEYALLSYINKAGNITAECIPDNNESNTFTLKIMLKDDVIFKSKDVSFYFSPYAFNNGLKKVEGIGEYPFAAISLFKLNPFLEWKIKHNTNNQEKEFITRIPILNMPDNRKQEVFNSIIQNQERFIQLIQFLLGAGDENETFGDKKKKGKKVKGDGASWFLDQNMYEELLMASSRDASKLIEIDKLIERLKKANAGHLIPQEFIDLWKIFKQVM